MRIFSSAESIGGGGGNDAEMESMGRSFPSWTDFWSHSWDWAKGGRGTLLPRVDDENAAVLQVSVLEEPLFHFWVAKAHWLDEGGIQSLPRPLKPTQAQSSPLTLTLGEGWLARWPLPWLAWPRLWPLLSSIDASANVERVEG